MKILFWNTHKKDLSDHVCALANDTNAEIVILNETGASKKKSLTKLQKAVDPNFIAVDSKSEERFHCFCRMPSLSLGEVHKGFRSSYQEFKFGKKSLIVGLVHGIDIRNNDEKHRQSFAERLGQEIRFVRQQQENNQILMIGDFNMNPFDAGMNLARGFNAMMARSCTKRRHRGYQGQKFEFYYNPMWSLLGDDSPGPPGTVYDMSNQGPYGWSMLDQVVLNYSLVSSFEGVEILTTAGAENLLDKHDRPDKKNLSDHLPIFVTLNGKTK